jgi:hypothetical protein
MCAPSRSTVVAVGLATPALSAISSCVASIVVPCSSTRPNRSRSSTSRRRTRTSARSQHSSVARAVLDARSIERSRPSARPSDGTATQTLRTSSRPTARAVVVVMATAETGCRSLGWNTVCKPMAFPAPAKPIETAWPVESTDRCAMRPWQMRNTVSPWSRAWKTTSPAAKRRRTDRRNSSCATASERLSAVPGPKCRVHGSSDSSAAFTKALPGERPEAWRPRTSPREQTHRYTAVTRLRLRVRPVARAVSAHETKLGRRPGQERFMNAGFPAGLRPGSLSLEEMVPD